MRSPLSTDVRSVWVISPLMVKVRIKGRVKLILDLCLRGGNFYTEPVGPTESDPAVPEGPHCVVLCLDLCLALLQ